MIKILSILFIAALASCSVQKYIEHDNLENCSISKIPKEFFFLDIPDLKENIKKINTDRVVKENDSIKITTIALSAYNKNTEYYSVLKTLKNNSETFFVYDSLGRLARKYDTHTGTNIGEEIKFKYSDIKSTTPIETYRVNYDTIYPVCWKEALQIATKKGVDPSKAEVNIVLPLKGWEPEKPMVWKIFDRKKVVHVDAYTGKVVLVGKPTPFSQY